MANPRPAVFLDRDGVLIEEANYLSRPEQVRMIPGSAEAVARLNRAGWAVVVVTNQSGVARGLFSLDQVGIIHDHIEKVLAAAGAHIDGWFVCPHHPTEGVGAFCVECECRKPKPGLLLQAAAELGLDLARSWMIGDSLRDLEAGEAAGCRTVLVRTGYGAQVVAETLDAANVAEAMDLHILK